MGLGGTTKAWQRQLKDFGHTEAEKYTTLVLDNRGMGESDKPFLRYTTSEMAKDLVELLDHVGWTEDRSVHVIGISMGGMIAQELVCLIFICLKLLVRGDHSTDSSITTGHAHPKAHL
jgi:pimeloyl-ACP methyl ester carboxylesterase